MSNEVLGLLLASATLLTGCTSAQSTPQSRTSGQVGEVPADMQSDYRSFSVNCSKCHDVERALAAPVYDHRHWDLYVAKMMRTAGSAINKEEAPHILRFLYWYTDQKKARGGDMGNAIETAPAPAPAPGPASQGAVVPVAPPPVAPPAPSVSSETQGESAP
jgi:cytochrome c5